MVAALRIVRLAEQWANRESFHLELCGRMGRPEGRPMLRRLEIKQIALSSADE